MRTDDPETGKKFTDLDLITNGNLFMYIPFSFNKSHISVAASDTTAAGLTFLLYNLLASRENWDRLAREIRSKYNSPDEMTPASLQSIAFVDAVIHECTSSLLASDISAATSTPVTSKF